MSLTDLQYRRRAIWVSMGLLFGLFTSVKFLSNLSLHVQHGQTMLTALGLAFVGTIGYALVMAILVIAIGLGLMILVRSILNSDSERE